MTDVGILPVASSPGTGPLQKKERIQIAQCTPSLGMVSIWWSRAVQCIFGENHSGKSIFYLRDGVGGEIAEVRNNLVQMVLDHKTPHSHVFWIDDDVLVFPGCLLELLHQYKDVVSGVYFTKMPGNLSSPLIYSTEGAGPDQFVPDAAYPVFAHGMGLTLVRTEVYRRMAAELDLGRDKYNRPQWYRTSDAATELREGDNGVVDTGYTEDTWFLRNCHRIGVHPHVVTTKHAFAFHYDATSDRGYPEKQWQQWISGAPIVWDVAEGEPVVWE